VLNSLCCRKNYADIGTRTNTVYFRRLLPSRVELPGLQKEICRYWDSNQHSLFPKATGNKRSTNRAAERNMPILGLEPTQFISEAYCQHAFNYLGCRKKNADIGTRTNTVYFRRLLLARVKLPVLLKEICRYWDSNHHNLFPKATGNTRSTTWAAERNMPILGLEPTQFISERYCQHAFNYLGCRKNMPILGLEPSQFIFEGHCQHAFNYLGCRKKYADFGTRTNTVYFRRLLLARLNLPGL